MCCGFIALILVSRALIVTPISSENAADNLSCLGVTFMECGDASPLFLSPGGSLDLRDKLPAGDVWGESETIQERGIIAAFQA